MRLVCTDQQARATPAFATFDRTLDAFGFPASDRQVVSDFRFLSTIFSRLYANVGMVLLSFIHNLVALCGS